jgi:AcrR family transcriptional regulator
MGIVRRHEEVSGHVTHPGLPVDNPLAALPPTAQAILSAARELLVEHGYRSISYQKVAAAASVDKGTISYHFGNKAGLLAAVADSLIHDECLAVLRETQSYTGEDRVRHAVDGLRRITLAADAQRSWFEMLPYAMREADLKARMKAQYAWWFRMNLQWLGLDPAAFDADPRARGLTAVFAAVSDGLAMQVGLGIQTDLREAMDALEVMLRAAVADMVDGDASGQ